MENCKYDPSVSAPEREQQKGAASGQAPSQKEQRWAERMYLIAVGVSILYGLLFSALPAAIYLYPLAAGVMAIPVCTEKKVGKLLLLLLPSAVIITLLSGGMLSEPSPALIFFAMLVPLTALIIGTVQRRHLGGFYSAAGAAALGSVCFYGGICLPSVLEGRGAFALMTDAFRLTIQDMTDAFSAPEMAELFAGNEELLQTYKTLMASMPAGLEEIAPAIIFALGVGGGLLSVLFFLALTKKHRPVLGISAPGPFRSWSVPSDMRGGVIFLYILPLGLMLLDFEHSNAVYNVINVLLGIPLFVQGLSSIAFFLLLRRKPGSPLPVIVFVLIGFFFPLAFSLVSTIGLMDLLFGFRQKFILIKVMKKRPPSPPEDRR